MAKHNKHFFTAIPKYKRWVKARDQVLEVLHTKAQLQSADIMRKTLTNTLLAAKAFHHQLKTHDHHSIEAFDHHLKAVFHDAGISLYHIILHLRRTTYTLAKASEAEIIAQVSPGKRIAGKVTTADVHAIQGGNSFAGGPLYPRIRMYLNRMRSRILNQAQASALHSKSDHEFLLDVMASFPKARRIQRPKRILKPALMEADSLPSSVGREYSLGDDASASIDMVDEQAWQDMLAAYTDEFVPAWRAPEYIVDFPTLPENESWYAWEFERDLTNEFVQSVRDGQIDAAQENGITDFVWIAVVDGVTDACCLWRDGLLVSEIEDRLDEHEGEDDECDVEGDGLTPPIHFNCRCTLAPATDYIPEKPDDGKVEFDDWLNQD
jgi:hypothetical protein